MTTYTCKVWTAVSGVAIACLCLPTLTPAELVYLEQGGVVVGEGEHFSSRVAVPASPFDNWLIVPDEDAGAGTFSSARGRYVQSLPDQAGGGGGPNVPPEARYQMKISTPGTYQLYLRWAANQAVGGGGNADSIFADIVEIKDGGGGQADWYELTRNSGTFDWDSGGQAEVNQPGAADNPMTWNIPSAGTYTFRITQREDGSAVDAFVLQASSLPAPAGFGPAASLLATDNEVDSVTAEADSYVQKGNAGTNFGNSNSVVVKDSGSGTTTRKGYLRFDVSGQPLSELSNAELALEVSINNNGGTPQDPTPKTYTIDVYGLNDGDAGESWGEGTIDWNNAPANDTGDNDILSNATLLGQFGVPALNPDLESDPILVSFNNLMSDTPHALLDFLASDTDGQVTFILARDGGSNNLGFYSKEGAALDGALAPTLTLFAQIPEPSALALIALGLVSLGSIGWRRRR